MKKVFFLILLNLNAFLLSAFPFSSGDSLTVSLITYAPGELAYQKFGHTAIRFQDAADGADVVFNYGYFSFYTENFLFKFVQGDTQYYLGISDHEGTLSEYIARNSRVTEQILNLTSQEKERLLQILLVNYEPQNRVYLYNIAYDNCATRPRDRISDCVDGKVQFPLIPDTKTFRQWIAQFVGKNTWLMFGIDMTFGVKSDRVFPKFDAMFLPEVLMNEFEGANIIGTENEERRMVSQTNVIYEAQPEEIKPMPFVFLPMGVAIMLLLCGIIFTIAGCKQSRYYKLFDSLLYLVTGILGVILFFLAFFSIQPMVQSNFNLLWLNPLNLILAVIIWFKSCSRIILYYHYLNIGLIMMALIAAVSGIQYFNMAFYPLMFLLLIRSAAWIYISRKKVPAVKK